MAQKIVINESNSEFSSNTNLARASLEKSALGEPKGSAVIYSIYEMLYLLETGKAELISKNRKMGFEELIKIQSRKNKELKTKYLVYKDLRNKGHVLKAGLKFGADFRVYNKGEKPSKNHAKYLVHIVEEKNKMNLQEFCSKARVAHSTGKLLLLAIVDSEKDITYFEINWKKP
ncbi:tRNA-intron lyase [Candidatus Pacearchaeota archaeon]|nr:tRNA-intron lyase [Candidatus Pacearchaeota archaeon]